MALLCGPFERVPVIPSEARKRLFKNGAQVIGMMGKGIFWKSKAQNLVAVPGEGPKR